MAKRFPGIRPRGNRIQVDLVYEGRRCRYTLDVLPTPQGLEHAFNVRAAAKLDIAHGTFKPKKYFPNYKPRSLEQQSFTIKSALLQYLKNSEKALSASTYRDYSSAIHYHLIPQFGHMNIDELSSSHIRDWINDLNISGKRINNILIPLRKVFADAFFAEEIDYNPLDRIKNLRHITNPPDPFTLEEIQKILNSCNGRVRTLFQFAFWTGLRTSELIALDWSDVDSKLKFVYITKAEVRGQLKDTKTYAGRRSVQLFTPARDALAMLQGQTSHALRVFINPKTNKPWSSDGQIRKTAWIPTLKKAGVRYRRPYQTRHTYASQVLSLGADPMWVAQQMGHRDWGMIRLRYGRWMDESRPDISTDLEAKLAQIGHTWG